MWIRLCILIAPTSISDEEQLSVKLADQYFFDRQLDKMSSLQRNIIVIGHSTHGHTQPLQTIPKQTIAVSAWRGSLCKSHPANQPLISTTDSSRIAKFINANLTACAALKPPQPDFSNYYTSEIALAILHQQINTKAGYTRGSFFFFFLMYVPLNHFMCPIFYTSSYVKEQHKRNVLERY